VQKAVPMVNTITIFGNASIYKIICHLHKIVGRRYNSLTIKLYPPIHLAKQNLKTKIMKNVKNKLSTTIAILATVLFMSCSGDNRAIGPTCADGQNGKDGINGIDGNANVVSVLIENSSFINDNKRFSIDAITQNILNDGVLVVLAYMRISSVPSTWYSLPYFFNNQRVSISTIIVLLL